MKKGAKRGKGRPSSYTPWKAKAICMRLMMGESLRSICSRKYYPTKMSVLRWLHCNEGFRAQYTQAREVQQEVYLEELTELSDFEAGEGEENQDSNVRVQRNRLQIDTRKWIMERMAAKKYGTKQQHDHTSSDGSMTPAPTTIELVSPNVESSD